MALKDMNNIYENIGKYILTFGNFEKTIDLTIGIIFQNEFGTFTAYSLSQIITSRIDSTSKKIDILKDLINRIALNDEDKEAWNELLSDASYLNSIRNIYAHNMYGVDGDKFIKFIRKIDNKKIKEYTEEDLDKNLNLLEERYRQLFDSITFMQGIESGCWISKYPRLFLKKMKIV